MQLFQSVEEKGVEAAGSLEELEAEHKKSCLHCTKQEGVLNIVFGEGDPHAAIMFVGEGPGEEEDKQGRPFVGRAGKLLDKQIEAMGLKRREVYIANVVKARPPGNRIPTPDEAAKCMPYLIRQIELIKPRVIVALGATAGKYLLGEPTLAITKVRGEWRDFKGIPMMLTYHPAYVLRAYTEANRRAVWDDLKKVVERINKE